MAEQKPITLVVLISGYGSNLQSFLHAKQTGLAIDIRAVISNREEAYGLQRAQRAGIATHAIEHKKFANRESFDQALKTQIDVYQPDFIVLAGFMRRLTETFVKHFQGRIINIHPSLLPKYPGLETYQRALDAKDTYHGTTVHYVTEVLDGGPIIAQVKFPIKLDDDEHRLAVRTQQLEHRLYPRVLKWLTQGEMMFKDNAVWLKGKPLPACGVQLTEDQL